MTPEQLEKRSIIITIVASLSFGLIGILISLLSRSGAVFLDGLFSLIFAVVGVVTLYVSSLVQRPRDDQYPFGYATFEPMLNLFKGVLITSALLYGVWTAVSALLTGGQDVSASGGVIYAVIAVVGGTGLVIVLRIFAKRSGSPIVEVDAKNAVIDTLISAAVGVAFVVTILIQNSDWSDWAPYADPIIMLAIAVIAAPQPYQIIRENWGQLMGRAPDSQVRDRINDIVESALGDVPHTETHIRTTEVGRYMYVHIYVIVPRETDDPVDVRLHDRIRRRVYNDLSKEYRHLALDLAFTMDLMWAMNSVPSEEQETVYVSSDLQYDKNLPIDRL